MKSKHNKNSKRQRNKQNADKNKECQRNVYTKNIEAKKRMNSSATLFVRLKSWIMRIINTAMNSKKILNSHPSTLSWSLKIYRFFLIFKQIFWGNGDLMIKAAGLSFYSLSGIGALLALIIIILEGNSTDSSLSNFFALISAQDSSTVESIISIINKLISGTKDNLSKGTFWSFFFVIFLLYSAFAFIRSLEEFVNSIWQNENRNIRERINFSLIFILLAILFAISGCYISQFLQIPNNNIIVKLITQFIFLYPLFVFAYWWIPYSKIDLKNAAITAFIPTIFILLLNYFSPQGTAVLKQIAKVSLVVQILIQVYSFWSVFIFGITICCSMQKQDQFYMKDISGDLSPIYKRYLALVVASFIYKTASRDRGLGKSNNKISETYILKNLLRLNSEEETIKEIPPYKIPDVVLPDILKRLSNCNIVKLYREGKESFYEPSYDVQDFTVGEFLMNFDFSGRTDMDYTYVNKDSFVCDIFQGSYLSAYMEMDQLLIDVETPTGSNDEWEKPFDFESLWPSFLSAKKEKEEKSNKDSHIKNMIQGTKTFKCEKCGKIFEGPDVKWTVFSAPVRCPKCGNLTNHTPSFIDQLKKMVLTECDYHS